MTTLVGDSQVSAVNVRVGLAGTDFWALISKLSEDTDSQSVFLAVIV